jgi:multidrug efflux pump subunit AcrB
MSAVRRPPFDVDAGLKSWRQPMTSEKPPTVDSDALEKKIGAIEKEVATVKVVIRRASRTRLAMLLAVLLIIGIAILSFYNLAKSFGSKENLNLLAEKAKARAESTSKDALRHVTALKENSLPVLQEAFTAQVNKDTRKYQAVLDHEGQLLTKNLQTELEKKLRAHFEESSAKYQAILRDEFPDLEDPELLDKMYANVDGVMDRLVQEYYSDQIKQQIDGMGDKWLEFETAEEPQGDEPSLEMQFVATLFYLAAMKIDEKSVE